MFGRAPGRKVCPFPIFLMFLVLWGGGLLGGCTGPEGVTKRDPDAIDCRVRRELHLKYDGYPELRGVRIEMGEEGIVLYGTVSSKRDRRRAEEIADAMPGSGRITNRIQVREK